MLLWWHHRTCELACRHLFIILQNSENSSLILLMGQLTLYTNVSEVLTLFWGEFLLWYKITWQFSQIWRIKSKIKCICRNLRKSLDFVETPVLHVNFLHYCFTGRQFETIDICLTTRKLPTGKFISLISELKFTFCSLPALKKSERYCMEE